jgi:hypothetical protein
MKKNLVKLLLVLISMVFIGTGISVAAEKKPLSFKDLENAKNYFDDPRPVLKDLSLKKLLPPDVYAKLTYDQDKMKGLWADVIGFKAPEVVGKVAPDIKPGTYSYKDKAKYPGLKELMWPNLYQRFEAGGPPFACNYPEIKVVPTRQYYWALPIAEATKNNAEKAKLDKDGYLLEGTYVGGFPFPRPSGKFKAQEIVYNWQKRYYNHESVVIIAQPRGFNKALTMDFDGISEMSILRLNSRVIMPPLGWYDERAKERGEHRAVAMTDEAPRDRYGNVLSILESTDPDTFDQFLIYISGMRRVRRMSATDTQDAVGGQDIIYDDNESFAQRLTPKRYPYKFELIAEREYLVPAPQWDGSKYMSSKDHAFYNTEFERRPMYVVKLTQLDKNYVYSYRILYIDQETLLLHYIENYDQKGRLYRISENMPGFYPELGMFASMGWHSRDYIDTHSSFGRHFAIPAVWLGRQDVDMGGLTRKGK